MGTCDAMACIEAGEQGEILIRDKNIWGRVESAVEFADEDAIIQICNDAEILKGQAHDWSKRLCS